MENIPHHIDELMAKVLAGEANAEEKASLDVWLNFSEENKRYFRSFEILFKGASQSRQRQEFDTDAAWSSLREKIRKSQAGRYGSMNGIRSLPWYWKAAAALVLITVVGYLIVRQQPENSVALAVESGQVARQDTLPDGSIAFLNASTRLEYQYIAQEGTRKLKLKGEAYFEVDHREDSPFIIECADVFIEDIGTTFNVRAYPDATTVEVFVETGEVKVYTTLDSGLHLTAGETGIYNRQRKDFAKSEVRNENILSYKTKMFNFSDRDLRSIVDDLNRVYSTRVKLGNEKLGNCRLDVTFRDESIEAITDIIAETLGLNATRNDGEILLDGAGCEQ